jgi:meso-butanediol dehydrogenase / (S,S)-butanediol dehydrogenase / diacetyl reductase
MDELEGLTTIVTGAGHGIGAGIAKVLAREGARVALTGRNLERLHATAQEVVAAGGEAIALVHDVASPASCAEVVAQARETFGAIDALVNNAGISQRLPFRDIDEQTWDRVLDVNLKGTYLMVKAVLDEMLERGSGQIVNVASLIGKVGAPLFGHYVASKFATIGLTQSLAAELAPHGIRVNAVCPGTIRTAIWDEELRAVAAEEGVSVEDAWQQALDAIPLGRPQEPEDIGEVVAFLCSQRARNITGESININGGQLMD